MQLFPQIKHNLVLTGGMVNCPGLVERLQKELKDCNFNFIVDEYLMWKSIPYNTENEAFMPTPTTVG